LPDGWRKARNPVEFESKWPNALVLGPFFEQKRTELGKLIWNEAPPHNARHGRRDIEKYHVEVFLHLGPVAFLAPSQAPNPPIVKGRVPVLRGADD